jgi:hypothetical protein
MIRMSRYLALAVAVGALASAGCSQECGAAACLRGVGVSLEGFAPGTYEVKIAVVTATAEAAPLATCTLTGGDAGGPLLCASPEAHSELGNQVRIDDTSYDRIQVTVSSNGAQVTQQTFDVHYSSEEINGPGCGVCTSATLTVTPSSST